MTRKSMIIEVNGMHVRVCYEERQRKTWDCTDCGKKRNPNSCEVCQQCGFMRDGCQLCNSDMQPAKKADGTELYKFIPGVKRLHRCVNPQCTGIAFK